jgi:hypothetical protein
LRFAGLRLPLGRLTPEIWELFADSEAGAQRPGVPGFTMTGYSLVFIDSF